MRLVSLLHGAFFLRCGKVPAKRNIQDTVLDKGGLEFGARDASRAGPQELSEDYRWMDTVLKVMGGLVVPLIKQDLISRWKDQRTLAALRLLADREARDRRFIPPSDVLETEDQDEAYSKLIDQLMHLKIFFELSDGRINMPDLFRLQANVKRRGYRGRGLEYSCFTGVCSDEEALFPSGFLGVRYPPAELSTIASRNVRSTSNPAVPSAQRADV